MARGSYYDFVKALGERESNNRYDSVNTFGYMGRWQFGKARLYDLGYSIDGYAPKGMPIKEKITTEYFLNNSALQDSIMHKHVHQLRRVLNLKYSRYLDKEINGVKITLSGLIAGAHLKGIGGVKQFLAGQDNKDAYGTSISEYIDKFGDYDIEKVLVISDNDIPKPRGIV